MAEMFRWAAKYENQSGSPEEPKEKTVVLENPYPDHKSALADAMGREPPFPGGVLQKVERVS